MAWRILAKASYAIEGERPPHNRAERRGHAIGQAGQQKLTLDEFIRLKKTSSKMIVFLHLGWRTGGGFIGVHDRTGNTPRSSLSPLGTYRPFNEGADHVARGPSQAEGELVRDREAVEFLCIQNCERGIGEDCRAQARLHGLCRLEIRRAGDDHLGEAPFVAASRSTVDRKSGRCWKRCAEWWIPGGR